MSHYRQQIREALAKLLVDAGTDAAGNVFTARARPVLEILQKQQAVLSVYTADETSERTPDGFSLRRELMVSVEGMTGGGDSADDAVDNIILQVEQAVLGNPTLGNLLAEDLVLGETAIDVGAKGNMAVGMFRLDFTAVYYTDWVQLPPPPPGYPPAKVYTDGEPIPDGYLRTIYATPVVAPDNVLAETQPSVEQPVVLANDIADDYPAQPPVANGGVCEDGTCAPDAWGGDKSDEVVGP